MRVLAIIDWNLTMKTLLDYQFGDGIATITLNDGKANVMSIHMLAAINAALDRALADKAVVMLTGRPGMFSGGFDLNVFKTNPEESVQMLEAGARLTLRLLSHPQPVLAVCTGHAVAMGCFILLGCDYRLGVDQGARIHAIEVQIGMTLPHFAIEVCRARLMPAHFSLACNTAWPYSPQQAVAAGFLDETAPAETLLAMAQERAVYLSKLHAEAFTATKLKMRKPLLDVLKNGIEQDVIAWRSRMLKAA
jgi:enoyl-CoA hydratase